MSTVISRRSFLKCTGVSAAALGAASLLGGCQSNGDDTVVEVKVGDTVRSWNGLGVQLTSCLLYTSALPLTVDDAEAIQKSWPGFFADAAPLGVEVEDA